MQTRAGILSLVAALLLIAACATLMSSCGGKCKCSGGGSGGGSMDKAEPDSLEARITLDEGGYAMGEPIVMTLEVTNTTDRTLRLTYPSAQRFDFIVAKGKLIFWRWSDGRMFAQVLGRYEMAPGETITYSHKWYQTTIDGTKPGLGAYTVEGVLMMTRHLKTGPKTFGIVD